MTQEITIVRTLAPEDVAVGSYVAVLERTSQVVNFCGLFDSDLSEPLVRRVNLMPRWSPVPLLVRAVCVPFVFVERPDGRSRVIDLRLHRLGRLSDGFGSAVFATLREQHGPRPEAEAEDHATVPSGAD